jgi:8-amino-7-oxononanoate synthase
LPHPPCPDTFETDADPFRLLPETHLHPVDSPHQPHHGLDGVPDAAHLVELMRHWAETEPEETAFRWIDPAGESRTITHRALWDRVRTVAASLQEAGKTGKPVLLLYPPGLDFLCGLAGAFAAGAIAVPSPLPLRPRRGERFLSILEDSGAGLVLTVASVEERLRNGPDALLPHAVPAVATDRLESAAEAWVDPRLSPDRIALLQYTSGSTARPKGVTLTHGNLIRNCGMIARCFGLKRSDLGVSWLPAYHDMGLVGGILVPWFGGKPGILFSPPAFFANPKLWLQTISEHGARVSGGPDSAYQWCVDRLSEADVAGLDLSRWDVAFTGSEPVRLETIEAFSRKFAPAGFRRDAFFPCYGMAEATLLVTGGPRGRIATLAVEAASLGRHRVVPCATDSPQSKLLVASGEVLEGVQVRVVDPETLTPLAEDSVGELWVRSPGVGTGYWHQDEATRATFGATLPDDPGPWLRTGDLGFLREGQLFVTGRCKDLLILRGVNHYPHDLEATCEAAAGDAVLRGGVAAFAIERNGREELALLAEAGRRPPGGHATTPEVLRRALLDAHDLAPSVILLVKPGSIPRTSSGKLQRHACRRLVEEGALEPVATWSAENPESAPPPPAIDPAATAALDPLLADLVGRHTGADAALLHPGTRLAADLGLDSVARLDLAHRIEVALGLSFADGELGNWDTLGDLQDSVNATRNATPTPVDPAADPATHVISEFPEVRRLARTRQALHDAGFENPYFHVHSSAGPGTTRVGGRELIHFGGYNYLGLSGHPEVSEAACRAIREEGTSSGASRLVGGTRSVHLALESALADFTGMEAAVAFVGGHATNETTLGHLFGPGDLILHDRLAHNSLVEGARLSGARRWSFPHNDPDALGAILAEQRSRYRRVLIVIEGVYSMDGDLPDLARFVELKERHRCLLMIDEAHSLGTLGATGRGLCEHAGVPAGKIDLLMGTLSKALASCGGFIAGSRDLVDYLRHTAPGFVYSVGMPPASAAAALAALEVLKREPYRVGRLQARSRHFHEGARRRGLAVGGCEGTPVVPLLAGGSVTALSWSERLFESGIVSPPVLYPAVPESGARLRFFITSEHSEAQIDRTLDTLQSLIRPSSVETPRAEPEPSLRTS